MNDAVDTISGTLISAVAALCLFPEAQTTAQDEIDAVVGGSRSPTWEDFDAARLPYVTALAKEILRWRNMTMLGIATEASLQDHVYQGYFIPKGTRLLCNIQGTHWAPPQFFNPSALKPERFLGNGEDWLVFENPESTESNASGRKLEQTCGQDFAKGSILSALSRLLWAFDIKAGIGENVSTHPIFGFVQNCCRKRPDYLGTDF